MSGVKEFYLVGYSKCPSCGGNKLKHISTHILGDNFKCEDCKKGFDFGEYIKASIAKIEKQQRLQIFEKCYYEVNK